MRRMGLGLALIVHPFERQGSAHRRGVLTFHEFIELVRDADRQQVQECLALLAPVRVHVGLDIAATSSCNATRRIVLRPA
jgi:hypothetical protein